MSKITNAIWFSGRRGLVGVVEVDDQYDGLVYYIGIAPGKNEEDDKLEIAAWGSSFPKAAAQTLLYGAPLKESK